MMKRLIDLHTHFLPPVYVEALVKNRVEFIDGLPMDWCKKNVLNWTLEKQLKHQELLGIDKAYLSISSPGVHLTPGDDQAGRQLAAACNDWLAEAVHTQPLRLGGFASLPLPDEEGSVAEIKRVHSKYGMKHFIVLSNAHGIYLGDSRFDSVWAELNRIGAVLAIHPTAPCVLSRAGAPTNTAPAFWSPENNTASSDGSGNNVPLSLHHGNPLLSQYPDPVIEYSFETTRALTSLLLHGAFAKFPRIRYIVPHAGAALPSVLDRIISIAPHLPSNEYYQKPKADGMLQDLLRQCWFDLAGEFIIQVSI
jgi:predicted TIM-barrel fold metal-dependent hydrolase